MRTNRHLTLDGRTMIIAEWARELGLTPVIIQRRLRKGLPVEAVLAHR